LLCAVTNSMQASSCRRHRGYYAVEDPLTAEGGEEHLDVRLVANGRWPALPDGVVLAEGIDVDAEDPAEEERGRRRCIATKKAGGRCTAPAANGYLLCGVHAGLADPRKGALARAQKLREARERREERAALSRMGTRSVVATALAEKAEQVHKAVALLCDSAAAGDLKSAQALIPWLNQALGMPTERVEHRKPSSLDELEQMDTEQLEQLVAAGRKRRLAAVPEPSRVADSVHRSDQPGGTEGHPPQRAELRGS